MGAAEPVAARWVCRPRRRSWHGRWSHGRGPAGRGGTRAGSGMTAPGGGAGMESPGGRGGMGGGKAPRRHGTRRQWAWAAWVMVEWVMVERAMAPAAGAIAWEAGHGLRGGRPDLTRRDHGGRRFDRFRHRGFGFGLRTPVSLHALSPLARPVPAPPVLRPADRLVPRRNAALCVGSADARSRPDSNCGCLVAGVGPEAPSVPARQGSPKPRGAPPRRRGTLCDAIQASARRSGLPYPFFTRLIWQEKSVRSWRGEPGRRAAGVAQFMPGDGSGAPGSPTRSSRPARSIESAAYLKELREKFGNLGLAAAAYNAGPGRVARWLAGHAGLPLETIGYVEIVTGHAAEDWRGPFPGGEKPPALAPEPGFSCLALRWQRRAPARAYGTRRAWRPAAESAGR